MSQLGVLRLLERRDDYLEEDRGIGNSLTASYTKFVQNGHDHRQIAYVTPPSTQSKVRRSIIQALRRFQTMSWGQCILELTFRFAMCSGIILPDYYI